MRKLLTLLLLILGVSQGYSQELKCNVTVIAPTITNVDKSVFETMESTIRDFMNNRKWTNDTFDPSEQIEFNMQITINQAQSQTSFSGTMQIQSSRPIYMSDYNSSLFLVNDNKFQFRFLPNTVIDFSLDQHRDNLSSLLAYYAYMMIGYDYDSYSMNGGTSYFEKAQTIVTNAQGAAEQGWRAPENKNNRYWMVDYILSAPFSPFREGLYNFHRKGLDVMYKNSDNGRKIIKDAIIALKPVHQSRPSNIILQLYFLTKSDEIVNIFKDAPQDEKKQIYDALVKIDPSNITKYNKMIE